MLSRWAAGQPDHPEALAGRADQHRSSVWSLVPQRAAPPGIQTLWTLNPITSVKHHPRSSDHSRQTCPHHHPHQLTLPSSFLSHLAHLSFHTRENATLCVPHNLSRLQSPHHTHSWTWNTAWLPGSMCLIVFQLLGGWPLSPSGARTRTGPAPRTGSTATLTNPQSSPGPGPQIPLGGLRGQSLTLRETRGRKGQQGQKQVPAGLEATMHMAVAAPATTQDGHPGSGCSFWP